MDKMGRRAVETLKEGKEIEYGLLGIQPEAHTNRVRDVNPTLQPPRDTILVNDEIIAVNDTPVVDFDSLILAVNAYSAGDAVRLKIRRDGKTIERTLVLAKYPVDGEVIVTNRPKPWRGLRVDYTSTLKFQPFLRDSLDPAAAGSRRGRSRGRVAGRRRGDQERPVDPAKSATKAVRSPATFMKPSPP